MLTLKVVEHHSAVLKIPLAFVSTGEVEELFDDVHKHIHLLQNRYLLL